MTPGTHSRPRDLVLAAAQGYGWETLRPFVESIRATGFDGEVRFFVSDIDGATVERLQEAGVALTWPRRYALRIRGRRVGPFNPRLRWPGLPALVGAAPLSARARLLGTVSNIDVARYFWSWLHLAGSRSSYRNVMLTDVRDVLFLRDPFRFDVGDAVCCFLEDERQTLGTQWMNRGWLEAAYGSDVADSLADRAISCSGVTIGSARAVQAYLAVMVRELARLPRQPSGIDQGVHNYVVHSGHVPEVRPLGNDTGPVLTIGIMSDEDAEKLVLARLDDANVVHQYDRHPRAIEAARRRG